MNHEIPKISEAEWEVMKVLWARAPRGSAEIVAELAPRMDWKPNTIKTLLARLIKKGAVRAEKQSRDYSYAPLLSEAQCVRAESRSFVSRVSEGSLMPLIAGFLQQEKLSRDEIAELRKMLDDMERRAKR